MPEFSELPILDISPLSGNSAIEKEALARDFARIYGELGFGYITGHGIDPALIDAVFEQNRRFHDLPVTEKLKITLNEVHRGYIPYDTSTDVNSDFAEVTRPNQSESFMMMRGDAVADPSVYLSGPNQWPDLPGFREVLEKYALALTALGDRLMRLALTAIGAGEGFMSAFDTPTTWLRLLHYPPSPAESPDDLYGSAPHCDFGCLTLLAQDAVGGLQVMPRGGDWIDAPHIPGTFVVNVGDMLNRLSNDRLLSTPHRVINRTGQERYSVPFFYDPHVSTEIAPLPGTGKAKFESLKFGDFLRKELGDAYLAHGAELP